MQNPGLRPGLSYLQLYLLELGGGGSCFLPRDFFFRTQPIFLCVTVFAAPLLIQFVRTETDLVFEFELL
jgi:hypothetical protein